jgi:glycerol dehydrogenase
MDSPVWELVGERVSRGCADAGVDPLVLIVTGEVTYAAVEDLIAACVEHRPTVVVGLGGGKVLDSAKALSQRLAVPVMTVPTIASNDSPTSSAIAMYDENHFLVQVDMMQANPVAVLVDTELIATAPVHFLRSGIGDAIAKVYEAEGCASGTGLTPLGTRPLIIARPIAQVCHDTLRADAVQALADCGTRSVSPAIERVVEAVVLMSGLAFENGGLSLAHSLTRGLMRVEGSRDLLHGYHVAWGALVQVEAEGRPRDEVVDLAKFLYSVGLPVSSADLRLVSPWKEQHAIIARHTMSAPHLANLRVAVDENVIIGAIERVDGMSPRRVNS